MFFQMRLKDVQNVHGHLLSVSGEIELGILHVQSLDKNFELQPGLRCLDGTKGQT